MAYELTDLCADARAALMEDPGTAGRLKLCGYLEKLLANDAFVAEHLGPDKPSGATRIYQDPDLGFCVLAHVNRTPSKNTPHDHGPSWAVYGMAMNFTDMTEWRHVDNGGGPRLEQTKAYRLEQGKAVLFDTGVIHSLDRPLETRLVRITGAELDTVLRHRYNAETGAVTEMPPTAEVVRETLAAGE